MGAMKNLYLHIGHGKTGSSYIQSCLALSTELLADRNIVYPEHKNSEIAKSGKILWRGNYAVLEKIIFSQDLESAIQKTFNNKNSYLFSHEGLWNLLGTTDFRKRLIKVSELAGFDTIKMLLFIRNPIEFASSAYQQMIKRGGQHISIEEFFANHPLTLTPVAVNKFLRAFQKQDRVELTVLNYSVVKDEVIEQVASWLEIPPNLIVQPSNLVVNRSMKFAELELQRMLNRILGKCGRIMSDRLCYELPELPADEIFPSEEVQCRMLSKLETAINNVNSMVDKSQQYSHDIRPATNFSTKTLTFTNEQLSVIANGLAGEIKSLRRQNRQLLVKSHFFRGRVHQLEKQFDRAINDFRLVLELMPDHPKAQAHLDKCVHQVKTHSVNGTTLEKVKSNIVQNDDCNPVDLRLLPRPLKLELLESHDKIILEVERLSQNKTDLLSGFALDSPKAEIQYDANSIPIKGWVLGKNSRAVKVKVSCGDQVLEEATVNNARPDVAKVHSKVPGAGKSGFATIVSLVEMPSNCELVIQAILEDGSCISIAKVRSDNQPIHLLDNSLVKQEKIDEAIATVSKNNYTKFLSKK